MSVAFPYLRVNAELQDLVDFHFRIRPSQYAKHQFPAQIELPSDRVVRRPDNWTGTPLE